MKTLSLENEYVLLCSKLETRVNELAQRLPVLRGFWERWCKEHQSITRVLNTFELGGRQSSEGDPTWTDFLKLRQRMVSTLGQGMKSAGTTLSMREELKELLREHDLGFMALLQKELERVKEQMTHAFAVKKTVSAYAQTAQYRGE